MSAITVLYAREDSHYKEMPGLDVYDIKRDALTAKPDGPVVAHPPCRCWGQLRWLAKPKDREAEKNLARKAVDIVRSNGGVLEHPVKSTLWPDKGLPYPGDGCDVHGGYTIEIEQYDFGHLCKKPTLLYIVGCPLNKLPSLPPRNRTKPLYSICGYTKRRRKGIGGGRKGTMNASQKIREMTPVKLGKWLIETAQRCKKGKKHKCIKCLLHVGACCV